MREIDPTQQSFGIVLLSVICCLSTGASGQQENAGEADAAETDIQRRLYVADRPSGVSIYDAEDGAVKTVIETGRGRQYDEHSIAQHGPHNTWMNGDGSRVYLELLTVPYVLIADIATNKVIGRVGPFSRGVRPFAVSADELYVYVYDAGCMPPKQIANVPLFANANDLPGSGWVSFSIGGDYAYPDRGPVIDVRTRMPIADIPLTEKLLEIRFTAESKPVAAGRR